MRNLKIRDYTLISILFAVVMGYILYLRSRGFIFGSNVDWISQHVAIPEYFRNLFYQDGTYDLPMT